MAKDELLDALRAATADVTYPSETDAPLTAFAWPAGPPTARKAVAANAKLVEPVDEQSADQFFNDMATVDGFGAIRAAMTRLADRGVVRCGEVNVAVYVLGRDAAGRWVGFRTEAVET